jgi:hypothetical protein
VRIVLVKENAVNIRVTFLAFQVGKQRRKVSLLINRGKLLLILGLIVALGIWVLQVT